MHERGRELAGSEGGRQALALHAPEPAAAVEALEAAVWELPDVDLTDLAARVCGSVQGIPPLARPRERGPGPWHLRDAARCRSFDDLDADRRVALAFVEQFSLDVSGISEGQRSALRRALGDGAVPFAQAVYVLDVMPRLRFALDRLFGASAPGPEAHARPGDDGAGVWHAIEELIRVVPGLQQLDAVTTELVRLRGARQHRCRICQSLRSHSALAAGADDATFDAVDRYATSDLPEAIRAALAFTDAFIWTPGRIGASEVQPLRAHFTPAQQVELVLDIARNASNKFAVSMAVDDARVEQGYEIYEVSPDGSIHYGLTRP